MNKSDLLIQIEVSRSKSSRDCEFATGYPIGRDRIITAAHVLKFKSPLIEAFFQNHNHPASYSRKPCEVVWDGRKDHASGAAVDVAVLECELPQHFPSSIPLLEKHPKGRVDADAQGYPEITRKGNRQAPLDAFGKFAPMPMGQREFELHCDDKLNDPEKWKGVSGAPVFVGDQLAGIIYRYQGTHTHDHFKAIAIFRLLEDGRFREAIHWSDRIDLEARSEIKAEIKERLTAIANEKIKPGRRETTILPYLREVLGPEASHCGSEDDLAEYLLEPREATLDSLVAVHKELCEEDKQKEALVLGEIADLITPLQMPRELWDSVIDQIRRSRPLIENAAPGLVSAEVIAARIDATSQKLPTPLGVSGGDDDQINYTHMIQKRETSYFPLKRPGTTKNSFVGDLYASQFGTDPGGELMSAEDKLGRLEGDCRSWRNIYKRSRYIVVQMPSPTGKEQVERDHWMDVLDDVKQKLEHVLLIELCKRGVDRKFHVFDGAVFRCLNVRLQSERRWRPK